MVTTARVKIARDIHLSWGLKQWNKRNAVTGTCVYVDDATMNVLPT